MSDTFDKALSKMQMRISNAWEAWDGAEPEDQDDMFEKYGDETDAAEREFKETILKHYLQKQDILKNFRSVEEIEKALPPREVELGVKDKSLIMYKRGFNVAIDDIRKKLGLI